MGCDIGMRQGHTEQVQYLLDSKSGKVAIGSGERSPQILHLY